MAEGLEPRPFSKMGFAIRSFTDSTTAITPGGKWYSLDCAVAGKSMIALAGFGVDNPNNVRITNVSISYVGTVSLYMINSSSSNLTGFNIVGLYVNSAEVV